MRTKVTNAYVSMTGIMSLPNPTGEVLTIEYDGKVIGQSKTNYFNLDMNGRDPRLLEVYRETFTNGIPPYDLELLIILSEEAGEIVQAVSKIIRHGRYSRNPDNNQSATNIDHLNKELGDLIGVMEKLVERKILIESRIRDSADRKMINTAKYMHEKE